MPVVNVYFPRIFCIFNFKIAGDPFTIPPVQPSPQPPLDVLIPARNRRQAMDWSLVLASPGIEHVVDQNETTGWTLAVAQADVEANAARALVNVSPNRSSPARTSYGCRHVADRFRCRS